MALEIVRNDITKMHVDAIVNAANNSLLGGGGVDGAIHAAAGPDLLKECRTLHGCETGDAKLTKGYNLPCKYVIHAVGPVWHGGHHDERRLLRSCYRKSLELARENDCESIAFPLISAGVFGYPKDKALQEAIDVITAFLMKNDMTVYLVVFNKKAFELTSRLFHNVQAYIDDVYVVEHERPDREIYFENRAWLHAPAALEDALEDALKDVDETFAQMLLRKIDEKHMTDAQCYKRANVDRRLFNKIKNNIDYAPSKPTVLAFAIALELSLEETRKMLMTAGFALSHSSKADIVVEYCLKNGFYNVIEINEMLFKLDLQPLGY